MSDDDIQVRIEGEDSGQSGDADMAKIHEDIARSRAETAKLQAGNAATKTFIAQTRLETAAVKLQTEETNLKMQLERARRDLDPDAEQQALLGLTQVEAQKIRLGEYETALMQQARQPVDPVEKYAQGRQPQTQQWLREHRDYVVDAGKNAELTRAHHAALADGHAADSRSYFEAIEKRLGLRDRAPLKERAPEGFIAGKPETHLRDGKIYLTKNEVTAATDGSLTWETGPNRGKPLGVAEFSRRKALLIKQGAFNRLD